MTESDMKQHALVVAGLYAWLADDMKKRIHDIDEHNFCSAVVELNNKVVGTFFSYSNPTALNKDTLKNYEFIDGKVDKKLINREGMQDLGKVRMHALALAGGQDDDLEH